MIKKNKAVFLDRDGVINKKRNDYVKSVEELEIFPDSGELISKLKKMGYLIIIITNQSIINRGIITNLELKKIHMAIKEKCDIDKFYFCPHRPDENCDCRKPKSGLLVRAIEDFSINTSNSWMIGDCLTDIQAGEKVGCKTFLLKDNVSLSEAVKIIETERD